MKVTIEKVENGYLVMVFDGRIFVAERITSHSYTYTTVAEILKSVLEPVEPKEVAA